MWCTDTQSQIATLGIIMPNNMPAIPVMTDPELLLAVHTLVGAALSFKESFLILANLAHENPEVSAYISKQASHLSMCESVVDHWAKQLDIETDIEQ